ncbi:MAG: hypothetical protein M0Z59_03345 [Nitrospiraceae bacterium]|nr:hypothetical protein [Nitrospiraceae bacterium]
MIEKNKGSQANVSGKLLERTVKEVFLSKGFQLVPYSEWKKNPEKFGNELLLTRIPFVTIYKHPGHTEFLAVSQKYNFKIRIECKWQQAAGSVDEKLPYLYLNCIEAMPEEKIIIIIDGGGPKRGSIEWLKNSAKQNRYNKTGIPKDILVFSLTEFMAWSNKTLR